MQKQMAAELEARRMEEARLKQERLLEMLRKEEISMALYKKWLAH